MEKSVCMRPVLCLRSPCDRHFRKAIHDNRVCEKSVSTWPNGQNNRLEFKQHLADQENAIYGTLEGRTVRIFLQGSRNDMVIRGIKFSIERWPFNILRHLY